MYCTVLYYGLNHSVEIKDNTVDTRIEVLADAHAGNSITRIHLFF